MGGCDAAGQGQQGCRALGPLPEGHLLETPGLGVFAASLKMTGHLYGIGGQVMKVQGSVAPRVLAVSLLAAFGWACSGGKAASPPPPATVAVIDVVKQDVPIRTEWVTTLDGYVNARIRPQVTGYLVKQDYVEGSYVQKDDVLFEIDPRPFQAARDQARAQLAQAEAQLGRATHDVDRDIPLAQARAIPRSQLDTDTQVKLAAAATVEAARAARSRRARSPTATRRSIWSSPAGPSILIRASSCSAIARSIRPRAPSGSRRPSPTRATSCAQASSGGCARRSR